MVTVEPENHSYQQAGKKLIDITPQFQYQLKVDHCSVIPETYF